MVHQVILGAINRDEYASDIGSVEGFVFMACAIGSDIAVLDANLSRIQLLQPITCEQLVSPKISCCYDTGKIAVAYGSLIRVFEPMSTSSLLTEDRNDTDQLYQWILSEEIPTECQIDSILWSLEGLRLLVVQHQLISLYQHDSVQTVAKDNECGKSNWEVVWKTELAQAVKFVQYSPDGVFLAVASEDNHTVRIFYQELVNETELAFNYILLHHPEPVRGFQWRNSGRYIPRKSIAASLITWCADNTSRIWRETQTTELAAIEVSGDGGEPFWEHIRSRKFLGKEVHLKKTTSRIVSKFKKIVTEKKRKYKDRSSNSDSLRPSLSLIAVYPIPHHSQGNVQFHLAATINAELDFPQQSATNFHTNNNKSLFVHWLNNKELSFNLESERILIDALMKVLMHTKYVSTDSTQSDSSDRDELGSSYKLEVECKKEKTDINVQNVLDTNIEMLLHRWENTSDIIYAISPIDGSLMLWSVDWLDNPHRQPITSFCTRFSGILSLSDFHTLRPNLKTFCAHEPLYQVLLRHDHDLKDINMEQFVEYRNRQHNLYLLSSHDNGSLNLWDMKLDQNSDFSRVLNVTHVGRMCGHNHDIKKIVTHPILPFVITSSRNVELSDNISDDMNSLKSSEAILWKTNPVGPLSKTGGLEEVARVHEVVSAYEHFCWLQLDARLSSSGNSEMKEQPIPCFVTNVGFDFVFYQINVEERETNGSHKNEAILTEVGRIRDALKAETEIKFLHIFSKAHLKNIIKNEDNIDNKGCYYLVIIDEVKEKNRMVIYSLDVSQTNGSLTLSYTYNSTQLIKLPERVKINGAVASIGSASLEAILPVCPVAYHLITSLTDNSIMFWELSADSEKIHLKEWKMITNNKSSSVKIDGDILAISAAHHALFSVATLNQDKQILLEVFECESTGGVQWIKEDILLFSSTERDNSQISLSWVSSEEGRFLIMISIDDEVHFYCKTSPDEEQKNISLMKEKDSSLRRLSVREVTIPGDGNTQQSKWLCIRSLKLSNTNSYSSVKSCFTRDGLLLIGRNREFNVFNQWELEANGLISYSEQNLQRKKTQIGSSTVSQDMFTTWMLTESSCIGKISDGLFDASYFTSPCLPQYHPKQLTALLNAGKTKRVKAILLNVLKSLKRHESSHTTGRKPSMRKRMSIDAENVADELLQEGATEGSMDYYEFKNFSPVPIHALMEVDELSLNTQKTNHSSENGNFGVNFHLMDECLTDDDEFNFDDDNEDMNDSSSANLNVDDKDEGFSVIFTTDHNRRLTELLTHIHLPGLSSVDQLHMLAIADTLSHFSGDIMEKLCSGTTNNTGNSVVSTVSSSSYLQSDYTTTANGVETVDECGLRYLMAIKQHEYLLICLPPKQKLELFKQGLSSSNVIWALHSETELEILKATPAWSKPSPTWDDMRAMGIAWWLKSPATIRTCLEKLAKASFQQNQDPMDASLFYLCLRKKNVLTHLFKTVQNTQMYQFFNNDFDQDHWKKVANKNAFVLMSKQRFRHAAAFFLLSGSLKDAVQIILNKCNDIQLAIVVIRVYETDIEKQHLILKEILCREVLNITVEGFDAARSNPEILENMENLADPFERSMAYWILKDYSRAASTLLNVAANNTSDHRYLSDIFNFYSYLRKHPLVVRQRLTDNGAQIGSIEKFIAVGKNLENVILPEERRLFFQSAAKHLACGCPMLALEILSRLPANLTVLEPCVGRRSFSISIDEEVPFLDIGSSNKEQSSGKGLFDSTAQYLKIVACLRILLEEFSTVMNRFSISEMDMSEKFLVWFEKEVDVFRSVCNANKTVDLKYILFRSFYLFSSLHSTDDLALSSALTELSILLQKYTEEEKALKNWSVMSSLFVPSPAQLIQRKTKDLLFSLCDIKLVPHEAMDSSRCHMLFKQSQALSSCVYQTLANLNECSLPTIFDVVISREDSGPNNTVIERKSYRPKKIIIESFVAISMCLFSVSLATHNTRWLYRLASQTLTRPICIALFGDVLSGSWIPPTQSILQFFAEKGAPADIDINAVDYDSEAEEEELDDEEKELNRMASPLKASYAWQLMRLGLIEQQKYVLKQLSSILGADVVSLTSHTSSVFQFLDSWSSQVRQQLFTVNEIPDEIMRYVVANLINTEFAKKYAFIVQSMPSNLFDTEMWPVASDKRLWQLLIRLPHLQNVLFPHIFISTSLKDDVDDVTEPIGSVSGGTSCEVGVAFKIAHRDNESIVAFASCQSKPGQLVLSNGKELQEMDVSTAMQLYASPNMNNNNKLHLYDIEHAEAVTEFLTDDYHLEFDNNKLNLEHSINMLSKKPSSGVRRLDAHPYEPLYVSGANDGSIRLWEWGSKQAVFTARAPGQHARVTKVSFSQNGNKFAAVDGDGMLCLWQICSSSDSVRKPFFSQRCNNKHAADVRFLGPSSSVLLTAGFSTGDYNIAIWDTLLPQNRALVSSWAAHTDGATCAGFLSTQQTILSGGKHGELCFWDVRQRSLRTSIKSFDVGSTITSLVIDPDEEFIVAGSSDGDIKIWSLDSTPQLLLEIPSETTSKQGFSFRPVGQSSGQGVVQLYLENKIRLLACGSDGVLRIHSLSVLNENSLI